MPERKTPSPEEIRAERANETSLRDREFAGKFGISEGQLVAAYCGENVTRIAAHPDKVMKAAESLGEIMALTRNESCVNERVGEYRNYHSGQHACMVLNNEIDLRMFPRHWQHAFMVEKDTQKGTQRSLQVFDAAGDAVHKSFLRESSNLDAWESIRVALRLDDQSQSLAVEPRKPVETPKADPAKRDILRKEWARMTDTHQFIRLTSKLKMNRLGAYRIVGAPFVRALAPSAVNDMLQKVQAGCFDVMIFVGNMGCIQIFSGPIGTLKEVGPWQNILDPGFNLHLRLDRVAEVWAVEKPTQRGPALSVEAFDADGGLIFQVFPISREENDTRPQWKALVETLEDAKTVSEVEA